MNCFELPASQNEKSTDQSIDYCNNQTKPITQQKKNRYVTFMEACRSNGAKVLIFSSLHVSGEQLQQLTGIAAILRYPLDDPDDSDDS
jgi:peptide subunit release factor 1 (eRF1)